MSDNKTEVEVVQQPSGQLNTTTPDALLALAVQQNFDIDKLQKLLELKQKWDEQQARKDYFHALSRFQGIVPEIKKSKQVKFPSKSGGDVNYFYAPLSEIVKQIQPALEKSELTYRWQTKQDNNTITVTCIITHTNGHQEINVMEGPNDDSSGKNPIQQRGSTITYLQRYTLIGALGLSSADSDVDARGKQTQPMGGNQESPKRSFTPDQYKEMVKKVISGDRTVEYWTKNYNLSQEQIDDLKANEPKKN